MALDLQGKVALVTGGASGIGLTVVEILARRGATVAVNFLSADPRGDEAVRRLQTSGHAVFGAPGDVASDVEAKAMVERAIEKTGRLDYLINNAGTSGTREPIPLSDFDTLTEQFWSDVLSTNLIGPFRCTRAAAPALRASRGAVCNISSVGGLDMVGSSLAYGASKAGLINMTKNLARALAPEVRVNAVAPGFVDTDWTRTWPTERRQVMIDKSLLKKPCTAEDIAAAIVFLCADNTIITGQTIVADGGLTLG